MQDYLSKTHLAGHQEDMDIPKTTIGCKNGLRLKPFSQHNTGWAHPRYMDAHLLHGLRCTIAQICTPSHQLQIEMGIHRYIF